jgi:hypothetical protein
MKARDLQAMGRYIDAVWAAAVVVWCAWGWLVVDASATFWTLIGVNVLRMAGTVLSDGCAMKVVVK